MKNIFKWTVLFSLALYIFYFFMPYLWEFIYDYETLNLLALNGWRSEVPYYNLVSFSFGFVYLIISIGLFLFNIWARTAFFYLTIATIIITPFLGASVMIKYDLMLSQIVTLLDGVILSMAYFTSISDEFKKS